jgi:mycothiol system anti-sigma-R factor
VITCAEAVKQLWAYLDRALAEDERARVDEHLAFCRTCCGEVEFGEELRRFLGSQRRDEVPPAVKERLERLLSQLTEEA